MSTIRPVFYVSDGTGITAETIGHSLLTQFSGFSFITDRMSFVDDPEKAREACARIQAAGERYQVRPIVVNSCVDQSLSLILADSGALMLDVFAPFIEPLERELASPRLARVGQAHGMVDFDTYHRRINAMNFALTHDDGIAVNYDDADVILVAVSRASRDLMRLLEAAPRTAGLSGDERATLVIAAQLLRDIVQRHAGTDGHAIAAVAAQVLPALDALEQLPSSR